MRQVVSATGLALQRNESVAPFPHVAKEADLQALSSRVVECLTRFEGATEWEVYPLDDLSLAVRALLVEQGLMTPEFARLSGAGRVLCVFGPGDASVEVNGSAHVRILGSRPGEKLPELWALLDSIDDYLEGELAYAFDTARGYLTASPAAAGTGLRAHVTVHVPALMVSGRLGPVAVGLASQGIGIVPVWEASGGLFQVFNKHTTGTNEAGILDRIGEATRQIAGKELTARKVLFQENPTRVRDYVGRALGVAQRAWSTTASEAVSLISAIRVGGELGILQPTLEAREAFALMRRLQPGNLVINEIRAAHGGLEDPGVDERRAAILRDTFGGTCAVI